MSDAGLELDTVHARSAAAGWHGWSDRVDGTRHSLTLDTADLALGPRADAVATRLSTAAVAFRTAATLIGLVCDATQHADRAAMPAAAHLDRLLELAARIVRSGATARARAGRLHAREHWLSEAPPAVARAWLEASRARADPADVLGRLDGTFAVAYWDVLGPDEQATLIDTRPDLVALRVLAAGGSVTGAQLQALDRANSYGLSSESWAASFGLSVGLRVVELQLGVDAFAITTKRSDGTVDLVVTEGVAAGIGADLGASEAIDVAAGIGAVGEVAHTFRFATDGEAARAIRLLASAVAHDTSLTEIARDAGRSVWNSAVAPVAVPVDIARRATSWIPGVSAVIDRIPTVPTFDMTPDTVAALAALWATNGVSRTDTIGVATNAGAALAAHVEALRAAVGAEARITAYDTSGHSRAGEPDRRGVLLSGTATADAGFDGRFVVDIGETEGEAPRLELTISGTFGTGAVADLIDVDGSSGRPDPARIGDTQTTGTVALSLPLDTQLAGDVAIVAGVLAAGRLPVDTIARLSDRADVAVTVEARTADTNGVGLDAVVASGDANVTRSRSDTVVAYHRYPGGELFSRAEVDRILSAQTARP